MGEPVVRAPLRSLTRADAEAATPVPAQLARAAHVAARLLLQRCDSAVAQMPAPLELARAMRRHAGGLLGAFNIEVAVHGVLPAADRPLLVVANHVSWLDSYVVNAVNGARFVAKSEVAAWPLIGPIAGRFGSFFHRRGCFRDARRTVDGVARALSNGYPVGVFPEGTTTAGDRLLPFHSAFFQAAIDARTLVQPVAIRYRTGDGCETTAPAYSDSTSLAESILDVLSSRRLIAELHFGTRLAPHSDRRDLADEARATIFRLLWPHGSDLTRRPPRRRQEAPLRLAS